MSLPRARRALAALALLSLAACTTPAATGPATTATTTAATTATTAAAAVPQPDFAGLEHRFDTHLGVYALDTGNGRELTHNADDRFGYASSHKAFSAAAVLERTSIDGLGKLLPYTAADLLPNSPVTEKHAGSGITLRDAMDAAVRYSDNCAANLLFRELGGPPGLATALRAAGDTTTHVDRTEPGLNELAPGDIRDTSTPRAMATTLRTFTLGTALPPEKRSLLTDMLRANTTGATVIRAGTPAGWVVGDKTGTGDHASRSDLAIVWPPGRAPIVLSVMTNRRATDAPHDDRLIAETARLVFAALGQGMPGR